METTNKTYKQQILHDVSMETQTTFMADGDINIFPCMWEKDKSPVTAGGEAKVRYRAGVMVEEDGRTRLKRYRDGMCGPKYETLFETAHGAVKTTRPWHRKTSSRKHKAGVSIRQGGSVYVSFKFPKKYGLALTKALYEEETDQIMSYLKTRKEETVW